MQDKFPDIEIKTEEIPTSFSNLVEKCSAVFKSDVALSRLRPSDIRGTFIRKLFKKAPPETECTQMGQFSQEP